MTRIEIPVFVKPDGVPIGKATLRDYGSIKGQIVVVIEDHSIVDELIKLHLVGFSKGLILGIDAVEAVMRREEPVDPKIQNPPAETSGLESYLDKARRLVFEYVSSRFDKSDPEVKFTIGDVYVVWFSKTLKNWKALVSTSLPDQMYYEITYDGEHKQSYLDAYKKHDNLCIPDLPRRERGWGYIPAGEDRFA